MGKGDAAIDTGESGEYLTGLSISRISIECPFIISIRMTL